MNAGQLAVNYSQSNIFALEQFAHLLLRAVVASSLSLWLVRLLRPIERQGKLRDPNAPLLVYHAAEKTCTNSRYALNR